MSKTAKFYDVTLEFIGGSIGGERVLTLLECQGWQPNLEFSPAPLLRFIATNSLGTTLVTREITIELQPAYAFSWRIYVIEAGVETTISGDKTANLDAAFDEVVDAADLYNLRNRARLEAVS